MEEPQPGQQKTAQMLIPRMTRSTSACWYTRELTEEAEENAQEALAMIEKGRRTLKEARAKQHQVKMNRQYYRMSPPKNPNWRADKQNSSVNCLKCGSAGHRTAQCPKKSSGHANEVHQETAPFVCFTESLDSEGTNSAHVVASGLTSEQAMLQGKVILDGGATRTLGSVKALEQVMDLNQKSRGDSGIKCVDSEQRPILGFGNSSVDRCLSTAWLKVLANGREGELKVHTLDRGARPILFSIETLRSLGAVIDFKEDLVVFRGLDATKIISLERSSTGHQPLPLAEDWYSNAKKATLTSPRSSTSHEEETSPKVAPCRRVRRAQCC